MKNLRALKAKIAKQEWYKQGAAIKLFYASYPWNACRHFRAFHKPLPVYYKNTVVYTSDDFMEVYFLKPVMKEVVDFYYGSFDRNSSFVKNLRANWEQTDVRAFLKIYTEALQTNLSLLNTAAFLKLYSKFSRVYYQLWQEAIFLDAFDVYGDQLLHEAIQKGRVSLSDDEIHFFTLPERLSWLQRERKSLLDLVSFYFSKKNPAPNFEGSLTQIAERYPKFISQLKFHSDKFHWIANDYAIVRHLGTEHFLAKAKELVKNPKLLAKEMKDLELPALVSKHKRNIIQKKRIGAKLASVIKLLVNLSDWRDSRKAYNQMGSAAVNRLARELSRRTGAKLGLVEYLDWREVPGFLKKPPLFLALLQKRLGNSFYFDIGNIHGKDKVAYGKSASAWVKFMRSLVGSQKLAGKTAYAGVVRGRARVVLSQKDFHKMKKGDILVAPNTRPEYVPIMKLAGAIVAEEGGMTSHSAIVSRELKIPCVVGVQGVLSAIKDGDLIEVDAVRGIVRKVK